MLQAFATYYAWDFGDGSPVVRTERHTDVETQSKVYSSRGVYTVSVTAYNSYGIKFTSAVVYVGGERRILTVYTVCASDNNTVLYAQLQGW